MKEYARIIARIIADIVYIVALIYAIANLSMPHTLKDGYFFAFVITGCSLGLMSSLRDEIIDKLKP